MEAAQRHGRLGPAGADDDRCGPDCQDVLLAMAHGQGVPTDDPSLRAELQALDFTMGHLHELEQDGLVIRIEGEPVAASVFERLDADVTAGHFEKAIRACLDAQNRAPRPFRWTRTADEIFARASRTCVRISDAGR